MTAVDPSDRDALAVDGLGLEDAGAAPAPHRGATIHYLRSPTTQARHVNAIVSVAQRLQEVLLEHGALPEDGPFPFPELAPTGQPCRRIHGRRLMPRAPNFAYQNPTGEIGSALVRAIFGDPQARDAQEQQQAEMDLRRAQAGQARSQGDFYDARTVGQRTANAAQAGLPGLARQWALSQQQPEPQNVLSPGFENFDQPLPDAPVRPDPITSLANFVGAMGQMNGDKIDPRQIMGTMGAFGGGDELARRGLIAQGHTPGKDFAITSDRADQIAANGYQAEQDKSFGVARINHANDIPVANISAGARRYAADASAGASRYGADVRAGASRDVAGIKAGGAAPGFNVIQNVFPNLSQPNSGLRSPEHNRSVGGVSNSYHLGTQPGTIAYDIPVQPGMTVDQAARAIEAKSPGVRVIEARDETGRVGPNGKALGGWHFALENVGGGGKAAAAAKPPKPISASSLSMIDTEIDKFYVGVTLPQEMKNGLRSRAIAHFRETGDPVQAVSQTIEEARAVSRRNAAKPKPAEEAKSSWWTWGDATPPKPKRRVGGTTTVGGSGGVPTFRDDASANAFVGDPRNKGKSFIGPDGKQRRVVG